MGTEPGPGARSTRRRVGIALLAVCLVAAACGGKKAGSSGTGGAGTAGTSLTMDVESGLQGAGTPVRGGQLVYGLEADTDGGFCLTEGQLAISGMMVVRAVYDTLTMPNAKGDYVPYLAKSVDHNAAYTSWTITLRPGITFHDGSPLTAQVVKNNLDAYRGKYPGRSSLLFLFVLSNIDSISTTGPLSLDVKMKKPWVAFPAYLYSSSRMGIMAQAQLDDKQTCDRKLIGTGPFKFVSWTPHQSLVAVRNPGYWQKAPDGQPYPYVDGITFRPMPDSTVMLNALQTGDANIAHTSSAADIGKWDTLRKSGALNLLVSEKYGEVAYTLLNSARPPFNDIRMRRALAMGIDRKLLNAIYNNGLPSLTDGPFAPGSPGYVKDPGFPKFDPVAAKKLVDAYRAEGKDPTFTFTNDASPTGIRLAELMQEQAKKVGITVNINTEDQAKTINDAIGGTFQAQGWRNHPGGDPDTQYVWWYGISNPVNFGRFNDPVINKLLDDARAEPDPAKRIQMYESVTREFAAQVWNVWTWLAPWAIAERPNVHGILGPKLPGGSDPNPGLATGHSLLGLWISKS
ncbi:MAG: ABC-type dipeptide transport system, periplasmic component [Acidimicrobiales bacterium]|nr:ABC-type dipeptide transport system, periplasmic component [Acidimicrobiales bacterium]